MRGPLRWGTIGPEEQAGLSALGGELVMGHIGDGDTAVWHTSHRR